MATATATIKVQCCICNKQKETYECKGCAQHFCFNHLAEHRQILNKQFDEIENDHDQFRQTIIQQKNDSKKHPFIEQIDKWETDSIQKIKQTAHQCRQQLIKYINASVIKTENKLNSLAEQIKEIRQENEFNEFDLNQLKEKLKKLEEEIDEPTNFSIEQGSTSFINKLSVVTTNDAKWKQVGITVAGGNGAGDQLYQLSHPYGIFINDDQTLYIADCVNHRIIEWKSNEQNGQKFVGGFGPRDQTYQLCGPSDVIMDKENNSFIISDRRNRRVMQWSRRNNTYSGQIIISDIDCYGLTTDKDGSLYVSDFKKNEVRRWKRGEKNGTVVAGGNGKGDHLNQLNYPTFIFVDEYYSLYVSDSWNHRVMEWEKDAKEGIVVAGGNGEGNSLTQLNCPEGVIVDQLGQIYVADWGNHRVMRWCKSVEKGTIIVGGNGQGQQSCQLNHPTGLQFDRQGNLYVTDGGNHRIQKFGN